MPPADVHMTTTIQACQTCGQTFWGAPPWNGVCLCPSCASQDGSDPGDEAAPAPMDSLTKRRFVTLSALPGGRTLPPKRGLAEPRAHKPRTDLPAPVDPEIPAPSAQQIGFNCPACYAVLIIKDPSAYNGKPAPCPCCGSRILPPRILPPSPFTLVSEPATDMPEDALPRPGQATGRTARALRPERPEAVLRDMLANG